MNACMDLSSYHRSTFGISMSLEQMTNRVLGMHLFFECWEVYF